MHPTRRMIFIGSLLALLALQTWAFGALSSAGRAASITCVNAVTSTKEARFVEWMTQDYWEEVPHPGRRLTVEGQIPSYVQGRYIKNGPGAFGTASRRYTHVFDGLAKLQKFDIADNSVTFVTKFVDSKILRAAQSEDRLPGHVATGPVEPPFGFWDVILHTLDFDNTNVNFEELSSSGTFCAATDAAVKNQIDPKTLETLGRLPLNHIQGMSTPVPSQFSTAHSKVNYVDGCTYNYYLELGLGKNWAHIVRTNKDLTQESIGKVEAGRKFSYVHEISVTENYAVLVLCPLVVNLGSVVKTGNLLPTLEFVEEQATRICLFHLRQEKPVQIFEAPPCWCYHHVNAYEDDENKVILDLIAYDTGAIANGPHGYLYLENMKTPEKRMLQEKEGALWRFAMDLDGASRFVVPEKKVVYDVGTGLPLCMELISVAPDRLGKNYRYVYGFTGFHKGTPGYLDWAILKQDVSENKRHGVWYQENMYPGEVTFVRNPKGKEEDDGVLLSTAYDSLRRENFLLILDAYTMKELARAYTGVAFPQSFHGKFYATKNDAS